MHTFIETFLLTTKTLNHMLSPVAANMSEWTISLFRAEADICFHVLSLTINTNEQMFQLFKEIRIYRSQKYLSTCKFWNKLNFVTADIILIVEIILFTTTITRLKFRTEIQKTKSSYTNPESHLTIRSIAKLWEKEANVWHSAFAIYPNAITLFLPHVSQIYPHIKALNTIPEILNKFHGCQKYKEFIIMNYFSRI